MSALLEELRGVVRLWHAQFLMLRYARAYKRAERLYPRMLQALEVINQDYQALRLWCEKCRR